MIVWCQKCETETVEVDFEEWEDRPECPKCLYAWLTTKTEKPWVIYREDRDNPGTYSLAEFFALKNDTYSYYEWFAPENIEARASERWYEVHIIRSEN